MPITTPVKIKTIPMMATISRQPVKRFGCGLLLVWPCVPAVAMQATLHNQYMLLGMVDIIARCSIDVHKRSLFAELLQVFVLSVFCSTKTCNSVSSQQIVVA